MTLVRADGSPVATSSEYSYRQQVEHLRRWTTFKGLANPWSGLRREVRIEVSTAERGTWYNGSDASHSLTANGAGVIELPYRVGPDGAVRPPMAHLVVHNDGNEALWIALFDVTDSFAITSLLPTTTVEPGATVALAGGQAVEITIPEHRLGAGATSVVDHLVAFVAEGRFDHTVFEMPRLEGEATRGIGGIEQVPGGLVRRALGPGSSGDWATAAVVMRTHLPA